MGLTFELTDVQVEQVNKWLEEHPCPVREHVERTRRLPVAGERMRFVFIPTFLGMLAGVECACGARLMLTDDL